MAGVPEVGPVQSVTLDSSKPGQVVTGTSKDRRWGRGPRLLQRFVRRHAARCSTVGPRRRDAAGALCRLRGDGPVNARKHLQRRISNRSGVILD